MKQSTRYQQPNSSTSTQDRWAYLWLFVGAGLLLFSNGRWFIPLATWLAPIFLIRFARTQPAGFPGLYFMGYYDFAAWVFV